MEQEKGPEKKSGFVNAVLKLGIAAGILIVGFSAFYHYVFFVPWQIRFEQIYSERGAYEGEKSSLAGGNDEFSPLAICLKDASEAFKSRWDKTCWGMGRPSDCSLPIKVATIYLDDYRKRKEECSGLHNQ
jgi:hypothetical protein